MQKSDEADNALHQLTTLFTLAEPSGLRKSLQEVFFHYLLAQKGELPADFETVVEDVQFLIRFLDGMDGE